MISIDYKSITSMKSISYDKFPVSTRLQRLWLAATHLLRGSVRIARGRTTFPVLQDQGAAPPIVELNVPLIQAALREREARFLD
jgi:hypothetical protein